LFADITFDALEKVMVKGKTQPVAIFYPHDRLILSGSESQENVSISEDSKHAKNSGTRGGRGVGVKKKIVGRVAEKNIVHECLQDLIQNKKGSVLILEGAAGMGKTTLLNFIRDTIADLQVINRSRMMIFTS